MNIDHLCLAVRSVDSAAARLCDLFGYRVATEKVRNTRQDVVVQFLRKSGSLDIKLIEPGSKQSDLVNFLKSGEGLHHVCFKTDDMNSTIAELRGKRARLLAGPQPGEAFENEDIAFLYVGLGLNVELIETSLRRGLLETGGNR